MKFAILFFIASHALAYVIDGSHILDPYKIWGLPAAYIVGYSLHIVFNWLVLPIGLLTLTRAAIAFVVGKQLPRQRSNKTERSSPEQISWFESFLEKNLAADPEISEIEKRLERLEYLKASSQKKVERQEKGLALA